MSADFPRSVSSSFRRGATVACAIYLLWASFLLFGPASGAPADGTNLVPLHTIRSQLERDVHGQLIGNLLLFTPLAIVLRWWGWRLVSILVGLVALSAAVEVGQAVIGRISDVDDVILNVAGGLRITEPAADLAVAAALISSAQDRPVPGTTVIFGEIALSGEVRSVGQSELRLKEAAKLGFARALGPKRRIRRGRAQRVPGIETREIDHLSGLFDFFAASSKPSAGRPANTGR